jgi:hypothetical protein
VFDTDAITRFDSASRRCPPPSTNHHHQFVLSTLVFGLCRCVIDQLKRPLLTTSNASGRQFADHASSFLLHFCDCFRRLDPHLHSETVAILLTLLLMKANVKRRSQTDQH